MNFRINKDNFKDNLLVTRLKSTTISVQTLSSLNNRLSTGLSPNPQTILVNSPLECDNGLIRKNTLQILDSPYIIKDTDSGRVILCTQHAQELILDSKLSSGTFGYILIDTTINNAPVSVVFKVGDDRILRGYYNNAGVITGFNVQSSVQNLQFVNGPTTEESASTIIKWIKINNGAVNVEAISGYNAFSLLNN